MSGRKAAKWYRLLNFLMFIRHTLKFEKNILCLWIIISKHPRTNTKDLICVSRRVRQYTGICFLEILLVSLVLTSHSCISPLSRHLKCSCLFYETCVITESSACFSPLPSILVPGWLCSVTSSVTGVALRLSICGIHGVFSLLRSDLTAWHRLPGVPLCVKSPPSVCHTTELNPQSGFVELLQ